MRKANPKPCPQCSVAQMWKVGAIDSYSSRVGVALKQTFLNFKTAFNGVEDERLVDCLQATEDFANHPEDRWLILWGDRGNGKSHLCAAVANHLINAARPCAYSSPCPTYWPR